VGLGGIAVGVSVAVSGVGLEGIAVNVSTSDSGVELGRRTVGEANPTPGKDVGAVGRSEVGSPQLVISREQATNVMKMEWDFGLEIGRFGAIVCFSLGIGQALIEFDLERWVFTPGSEGFNHVDF
jgi:hypothetical protein